MQTIIIDDEKPAINILTKFVGKIPFIELKLATTNAFAALEVLNTQKIDLLLLDIEMPDITGLELLNSLEQKPFVIFTTAYEQYALKGYELDIIDYLVKPIRFERFLKAINKAHQRYQSHQVPPIAPTNNFLFVKSAYKTLRIAFDDILYIEGLKDYVKIYTTAGMQMTRLNLKGIQSKLPIDDFIRIHRSYIISFSKITAFQKNQITINKKNLPIGETYAQSLFKKLI